MKRLIATLICLVLASAAWGSSLTLTGAGAPAAGGGGGCSQATTFLARTSGLNGTHTTAYTNFICGLVTDGLWTKFDALWVLATQDSTTAGLNLVSTSFTLTAVGTPTFTADQGYAGGASKRLTTGYTPSTSGVNLTQNSAHIAARINNEIGSEAAYAMGSSIATTYLHFIADLGGTAFGRINDFVSNAGAANTLSKGFWVVNRSGVSTEQIYRNATNLSGAQQTSSAPPSLELWLMDSDQTGGASNLPSSNQFSLFSVGGSLSSSDVTAYKARVDTYMTAVGAP